MSWYHWNIEQNNIQRILNSFTNLSRGKNSTNYNNMTDRLLCLCPVYETDKKKKRRSTKCYPFLRNKAVHALYTSITGKVKAFITLGCHKINVYGSSLTLLVPRSSAYSPRITICTTFTKLVEIDKIVSTVLM